MKAAGVLLLFLTTCAASCSGNETSNGGSGGEPENVDGGGRSEDDAAVAGAAPHDPGRYPVGVTRRILVDESRSEVHTADDPDDVRTLVTEIWYPATESSRGAGQSPFAEFITERDRQLARDLLMQGYGLTGEEVQTVFDTPTGAVRDADVAADARFPIVVFSHGNQATRWQMFQLAEHLASHGTVVIAPDHTYSAAATSLPEGVASYSPESGSFLDVRVEDLSYLVDVAEGLADDDPEGLFTGKLDPSRAGVMGQSLGGGTCLGALNTDDRFLAGACMAPVPTSPGPYDDPLLLQSGGKDETVPANIVEDIYAEASGPRWLVHVPDAGHLSLTTECLFQSETATGCGTDFVDWDTALDVGKYYLTAFFAHHLSDGDGRALTDDPFSAATLTYEGLVPQ